MSYIGKINLHKDVIFVRVEEKISQKKVTDGARHHLMRIHHLKINNYKIDQKMYKCNSNNYRHPSASNKQKRIPTTATANVISHGPRVLSCYMTNTCIGII